MEGLSQVIDGLLRFRWIPQKIDDAEGSLQLAAAEEDAFSDGGAQE